MNNTEAFKDFLLNKTVDKIGGDVYVKSAPFTVEGKDNTSVYPVYRGYSIRENIYYIPETLKLYGYWCDEKKLFILTDSCSSCYYDNNGITEIDSVKMMSDFAIIKMAENQVKEGTEKWLASDFDKIQAGDDINVLEEVTKLFNNGHKDIDVLAAVDNWKNHIFSDIFKEGKFDFLKYIAGDEKECNDKIELFKNHLSNCIKKNKAIKKELLEMVQKHSEDTSAEARVRAIKSLFIELAKTGLKNCKATFDFGYVKVTKKINIALPRSSWVENTRTATNQFEKNFLQPISMRGWFTDPEDFLPYITKIEVRNKVIYENSALENRLENKLYNQVFAKEGNFNFKPFEEMELDCSILTATGKNILSEYVNQFYSTVEGAKFFIEHGADGYDTLVYMIENEGIYRRNKSRNWDDIKKYLSNEYK